MSRQNTLSTQYNQHRLTTIFTIIGATGLIVVFSIFASIILKNSPSVLDDSGSNNDDNIISVTTSVQATQTPFPTINVLTPTPLPTLTEKQLNEFLGEFEQQDPGLLDEAPEEALNELRQVIDQAKKNQTENIQ